MTTRAPIARHRAEVSKARSISAIAKAVSSNAGGVGRQAAVIAAASGLVLTSGIAANAAEPSMTRVSDASSTLNVKAAAAQAVTAASTVKMSFPRTETSTTPAPVVETPAPVAAQADVVTPVVQAALANTSNAAPAAAAPVAATPAAAPAPAPAPAAASGVGATIAAAAYAQLGVVQDCTALVSNSLAAAGISYHGWPAGYLSLGRTVSAAEAQPGDLAYYADGGMGVAHIAVYVGNGQAIHGGWTGNQTVLFSANVGSGPVFIAIGH